MYLIDFFKRVTRKSNIQVLIYLVLNVFLISYLIHFAFEDGVSPAALIYGKALMASLALYIPSLAIALSPVGEWILRMQAGCKKIKSPAQLAAIEPLFREVYDKARQEDPAIPDDVQIFLNDDEDPNAFATGRRTVCMTRGLLRMPAEQIKATLAHEFGHLAHKDTDLLLVICVGNFIVSAFILMIRLFIELFHLAADLAALLFGGPDGAGMCLVNDLYHLLMTAIVAGLTRLWTWFGTVLVMKSSREQEYEADAFSVRLGYGDALCALLDTIVSGKGKGLFATLASSHPSKNDRIARIHALQGRGTELCGTILTGK